MMWLAQLPNRLNNILSSFDWYVIWIYLVILFGIILRLYNLDWGTPFYFHPDERNIIYAVTRLDLVKNLNPDFFAYGSLPIYIIYFFSLLHDVIWNLITKQEIHFLVSFNTAIITSRILSAFYSILSIFVIFNITKLLAFSKKNQLLIVLFALFNVGLIQYSHFGTFESFLTLFSLIYCFFLLLFIKTHKKIFYIASLLLFAVLVSAKISTLVLGILLLAPLFLLSIQKVHSKKGFLKIPSFLVYFFFSGFLSFLIIVCFFIITNPFSVLKFHNFQSSIAYESAVALGSQDVFYTGGFKSSIPIIYQLLHVYPFLLNPLGALLLLFSIGCVVMLFIKNKSFFRNPLFMLFAFFGLIFFSQAFLYVKWIRYYIPSLPFIYLLIVGIRDLLPKRYQKYYEWILHLTLIITLIHALAFTITVYSQKDTRVLADEWANEHIPKNSHVISEIFDMGIVPFNDNGWTIDLFDFYTLDTDPSTTQSLSEKIIVSDYIILPSTRISRSRHAHKNIFPQGNAFYTNLEKSDKFLLIYKTPCDIFCKIAYYGNGLSFFEETAYVFDRPTVLIYKIIK